MRDAGFGHVSIMTCELSQTPSPRIAQVAYILHEPSPTVCLVLGVYFFYYGMAAFAAVFGLATGVARGTLKTRNWAATGVRGEPHRGGCMAERQDFARYRANLQDEMDTAALY